MYNIEFCLLFYGSLRGGQTCDGHAEGRAAGIVHANLGAELHGAGLTADPDWDAFNGYTF